MTDTKELLRRAQRQITPPQDVMGSLIRRRNRKQRNQRIVAAVVAASVALLGFVVLARTYRSAPRPANANGIFSAVRGRIVYGGDADGDPYAGEAISGHAVPNGGWHIWALDPTRPNDAPVELSVPEGDVVGLPVTWSSDGSKLLMYDLSHQSERGWGDLYVLSADGTEVRVAHDVGLQPGGSFSPDGSEVVYSAPTDRPPDGSLEGDGIYVVSADGGTPHLVLAPERGGGTYETALSSPAFSPDGTQIVYVDGNREPRNTIRVMNPDGSGVRVLVDERTMPGGYCGWLGPILWSPDGSKLAFRCEEAIWVMGADGSGLIRVIPNASHPQWSPDGTQLAFQRPPFFDVVPSVLIATADGEDIRSIGQGSSGPWNPLPLPANEEET
jgi:hypothetical protein